MPKQIPLTNGEFAVVDDEDYLFYSKWSWKKHRGGYAVRTKGKNGIYYMHRSITNAKDGYQVDHINGNKLDNRKCNLRVVTRSQNALNVGVKRNNKSGHKGVYWDKARGKWSVQLTFEGKTYCLGRFIDKDKAIKAYRKKFSELVPEKVFKDGAWMNHVI